MKMWLIGIFALVIITTSIFFTTTVTSNAVNNKNDIIIIPVNVYVVDSGSYSSERTEQNAKDIFSKTNTVWREAGIFFDVKSFQVADVNDFLIREIINGNGASIQQTPFYNKNVLNIYMSNFVGGEANGLSLPIQSIVMLSDQTTVNDFRTLSHEFGHTLGLNHASDPNQLMFVGTNGIHLTKEEISIARATAFKIF